MEYRLNPRIKTTIPIHYMKKDGTISCGSLVGITTTNWENVDCPICLKNKKEKTQQPAFSVPLTELGGAYKGEMKK